MGSFLFQHRPFSATRDEAKRDEYTAAASGAGRGREQQDGDKAGGTGREADRPDPPWGRAEAAPHEAPTWRAPRQGGNAGHAPIGRAPFGHAHPALAYKSLARAR